MKLCFQKNALGLLTVIFSLSNNALAISTLSPESCPQKFMGQVERLAQPKAPFSSSFQKLEVTFDVQDVSRGDFASKHTIEILKNGPFSFKKGEHYEVLLRNNFVCSIRKIEHS